jgi:hypothetical protein
MSATVTSNTLNLRELLSKINGLINLYKQPQIVYRAFSGNGSITTFALPEGWKPYAIYVAGARQLDAVWSVTYDVNVASIVFTSAPASGTNNIQVDMVRI